MIPILIIAANLPPVLCILIPLIFLFFASPTKAVWDRGLFLYAMLCPSSPD